MRRLSPALLTMLMLGAIAVLVAMYFGKKMLFATVEQPEEQIDVIPMALTDLKAGTLITEAHIGMGRARASTITRDIARSNRILLNRIVKNDIKAAEPISTEDLYPAGEGPDPDVSPGMRALTLTLPAPMVRPGGFVDVHFTPSFTPDEARTGGTTMSLLKGVKVLQVNGNAQPGLATNADEAAVSLEVSVEQANILLLLKDKGELHLIYSPDGKGTGLVELSDEDRATLDEILGIKPPEPEKHDKAFVTEVYTGNGRRTQLFRDGKREDLYAIERYDYNRLNNPYGYGGYGYGGGYGGYGYGGGVGRAPAAPGFENSGWGGDYGGNYGGYYSVPSGNGGAGAPPRSANEATR
ncbi:MAG: Flp pilus assembly protein CpaB [Planctomycetaceae bacterium]|nr:Flp pilus assembly protein CpaB [Planctomycetaceae bacterium]MCB9954227.1 Flp pilus assembly protein CpaB [Planctomycetaceae bacterium]